MLIIYLSIYLSRDYILLANSIAMTLIPMGLLVVLYTRLWFIITK